MRIRSTKPEFWRSERIASVDWEARLVLKGLESYVDDNGVGKDDIALIVGDIFSRDLIREPSRTLAKVAEAMNTLQEGGLLHRYEVDGEALLYVAFWESVQRIDKPARGRLPRPDGTLEYGDSDIRASVANPREPSRTLAPGTEEQGDRGTEEQGDRGTEEQGDRGTGEVVAERADVTMLCTLLADLIEQNGSKRPTIGKGWHEAARLLIDKDGREVDKAARLIRWCQDDNFWRANILSMPKFREKYDQLRLAAEQKRTGYQTNTEQNMAYLASLRAEGQSGRLEIEGAA